ncbi:hypothetical protein [Actinoplanes sp. NPDC049118]|uniref:hypothetical protein n=1 Tax=Actinoplanes sp. NPDC049118 TaxID=3155769 RepID=UPI0033CD4332
MFSIGQRMQTNAECPIEDLQDFAVVGHRGWAEDRTRIWRGTVDGLGDPGDHIPQEFAESRRVAEPQVLVPSIRQPAVTARAWPGLRRRPALQQLQDLVRVDRRRTSKEGVDGVLVDRGEACYLGEDALAVGIAEILVGQKPCSPTANNTCLATAGECAKETVRSSSVASVLS